MLKVVVVEDEQIVRRGIILSLDWAGMGCVVVGEGANGEEGLEVIRRYQPDLVITDILMPKMDGIEMIRRMKEEGIPAHVVILTAHADFEYAQSAVRLGAVDYLLKPFRDGELEQVVERVAKQVRHGRAQAVPQVDLLAIQSGEKSRYVLDAISYIAQHFNDPDISVGAIAESLGLSGSHLSHLFKKETAYTIAGYLTNYRIHVAMQLLRDYRAKVYEVAEQVGYRDITYFSSTFKKVVGVSPSEYQRRCQ